MNTDGDGKGGSSVGDGDGDLDDMYSADQNCNADDGFTADGRHMSLGHTDDIPMPPGFNVADNSRIIPIIGGRVPNGDAIE